MGAVKGVNFYSSSSRDDGPRTQLQIGVRLKIKPTSISVMALQWRVREVITPAIESCSAKAVAQAAADVLLDGIDKRKERLRASSKGEINFLDFLHLKDQLAHDHRIHTLRNIQRGCHTFTRSELANQMRWFLEDYAASFF